jgi:hypothetical protein
MKTMRIFCIGVVMVLALSAVGHADILTLQQGLNGYAGCEDTLILKSNGYANFGGDDDFYMGRVPWVAEARGGLIRFNDIAGSGVNQVPAGMVISDATLRMKTKSASTSYVTRLFTMWTDWAEGSDPGSAGAMPEVGASCHNVRYYRADGDYAGNQGDAWGTGGVVEDGPVRNIDYDFDHEVTRTDNPGADVWMEFDITSAVQSWYDGSQANYGLYGFNNNTGTESRFWSSEDLVDGGARRPELVITYELVPEPMSMMLLMVSMPWLIKRGRKGSK